MTLSDHLAQEKLIKRIAVIDVLVLFDPQYRHVSFWPVHGSDKARPHLVLPLEELEDVCRRARASGDANGKTGDTARSHPTV